MNAKLRGVAKLRNQRLVVYTDGAIRPENGASGLAAIVKDEHDNIRYWMSWRTGRMTCNEAEYQAAIMALGALKAARPQQITLYTDSRIVVDQMRGHAAVRSAALRLLHIQLVKLVNEIGNVAFIHIPREMNLLADALANEAVQRSLPGPAEGR